MVDEVWLIRHGETAWSLSGKHTGLTDVTLTAHGEQQALDVGHLLRTTRFSQIEVSPLQRAQQTCRLALPGVVAKVDAGLREWNYGAYEGITTAQIRGHRPQWEVFADGAPGGESPDDIAARADAVIARLRNLDGCVAVFSHGHFLRALGVRWIGLTVAQGRNFLLDTGSLSVLAFERGGSAIPVIRQWNATSVR